MDYQCKGSDRLYWCEDLLKYMCPGCGKIIGQLPDAKEDEKRLMERLNLKPGEIFKKGEKG